MMRICLISLLLVCIPPDCYAQSSFSWTDSVFVVGQTKSITPLKRPLDGPCTVRPCYDYSDNSVTYDSIVNFMSGNKKISIILIWHQGTLGGSYYNFRVSQKMAEGLYKELIKLGLDKNRFSTIGLGESKPIISEETIKNKYDQSEWYIHDKQNNRIEIIITSVP